MELSSELSKAGKITGEEVIMNFAKLLEKYAAEGERTPDNRPKRPAPKQYGDDDMIEIPGIGLTPVDSPEKAALEATQLEAKKEKFRARLKMRLLKQYQLKTKELATEALTMTIG